MDLLRERRLCDSDRARFFDGGRARLPRCGTPGPGPSVGIPAAVPAGMLLLRPRGRIAGPPGDELARHQVRGGGTGATGVHGRLRGWGKGGVFARGGESGD